MTNVFVCLGHDVLAGCGKVLTSEERRYYGTVCEACERQWGERIITWRSGVADAELDQMFRCPPKVLN